MTNRQPTPITAHARTGRYTPRTTTLRMPDVTITAAHDVIWSGPYRDFERLWFTRLCVAEFVALDAQGFIVVGGGELPEWRISLDRMPARA